MAETCSHLPEEWWECIFKLVDDGDNNHYLEPLSLVSKQFLSITNRLRFSITISDKTIPFIPRLFDRFPNLTSLNITRFSTKSDLDELLTNISAFPVDIKSLTFFHCYSNIPADGLRVFSKNMKNLTSLTCYRINKIRKNDLFFVADCFPLLEELNLSHPVIATSFDFEKDDDDRLLALPKLRKINLSGNFIDRQSVNTLCKNCNLLRDVVVTDWF